MIKLKCLNEDEITLEVGCDGPSLPILMIQFKYYGKIKGMVLLDKEQTQELTQTLQRLQTEM